MEKRSTLREKERLDSISHRNIRGLMELEEREMSLGERN